jgi:hypothetical protein
MPDSQGLMVWRLNRVQSELNVVAAQAASGAAKVVLEEKDPY